MNLFQSVSLNNWHALTSIMGLDTLSLEVSGLMVFKPSPKHFPPFQTQEDSLAENQATNKVN